MKAEWITKKSIIKRSLHEDEAMVIDGRDHSSYVDVYDCTSLNDEDITTIVMSEYAELFSVSSKAEDDILSVETDFETQADVLEWCVKLIAHAPVIKSLWSDVMNDGWEIGLNSLHNQGYHLDIPRKQILLDDFAMSADMIGRSAYFRNDMILNLIRALRDIWHERNNHDTLLNYAPENIIILERVRAADCDTIAILGAWELRGAGYPEIWRHLIGSPEGDMALAFTQYLERDPSALFDGSALAYAFRQWFTDNERVNASDHEALEYMDDLIASLDEANPFGTAHLEGKAIERLSDLPNEICYLKRLGDMILEDPYYAGMNDTINQTHLYQMIYDLQVTVVNNVPFSDNDLARKIFPDGTNSEQLH